MEVGRAARKGLRIAAEDVRTLLRLALRRSARRRLGKGLRAPQRMPRRYQHVVVLLLLAGAALWGLGRVVLAALAPGLLRPWDLAWGVGGFAFLTTVALPVSYEPALLAAHETSGLVVAVLASAAGATLGAAVVFFLGGTLRRRMEANRAGHPRLARALDGLERFARRGSYLALAALLSVPLFPDTVPVYLFSLLGLRLAPFLAATFAGIAVRSAVVLSLGHALLG